MSSLESEGVITDIFIIVRFGIGQEIASTTMKLETLIL